MASNKEPGEDNLKSQQQLLNLYKSNVGEDNTSFGDNRDEDNTSFEEEEEYSMVEKSEMEENEKSQNMEREESDIEVLPSTAEYQTENSESSENEDEVEIGLVQKDVDSIVQITEEDPSDNEVKEEDIKNNPENDFRENGSENKELLEMKRRLSELEQRNKGFNFKIGTQVFVVAVFMAISCSLLNTKSSNDKELTAQVEKLIKELKRSQQDIEQGFSVEIDKHEKALHQIQIQIERQNMLLVQGKSLNGKDRNQGEEPIHNDMAAQELHIALLDLNEQFQNHKENIKTEIETAIKLEIKKYELKYDEHHVGKISEKFQNTIKEFNKIVETEEIKLEEKIKKSIEKEINPKTHKIIDELNHHTIENKEKEINEQINQKFIGLMYQVGMGILFMFVFAMASIKLIIDNKIRKEVDIQSSEVSEKFEILTKNMKQSFDIQINTEVGTLSAKLSEKFEILTKKVLQALFSTLPVQLQLISSKDDGPSGFYSLTSQQENGFPVYKKVTGMGVTFLSVSAQGFWEVKTELGPSSPLVKNQENNPTPIIPPESGWTYCKSSDDSSHESTSLSLTPIPEHISIGVTSEPEQEEDSKLKVTSVPVQLLVSSIGPSHTTQSNLMGVYRLSKEQVNNHPVYKRVAGLDSAETSGNPVEAFLYMSCMSGSMKWSVGYEVGSATYLRSVQDGNCPPPTDWEYSDGKWIKDPCLTVKVPFYNETGENLVTLLDPCTTEVIDEVSHMEEELDQMEEY